MIHNTKRYEIATIITSLILGVGFAVLIRFFPVLYPLGYRFGFLLSLIALLLETITASSLLRQDHRLNRCLCAAGLWVLIPALLLFGASMLGVIFASLEAAATITYPIASFLMYTLIAFTLFGLYRFLACLSKAGCPGCGCGE